VTMLVRSDLSTTSPTEVLGEILTQDIFKKSQADAISLAKKVKNESIALKAKASRAIEKEDNDDEENESESDGDMALFVKKFNKFMKKKRGNLEEAKHLEEMLSMIESVLSVGNPITSP
jgi:Skp family chaperone for outer membrane proteins